MENRRFLNHFQPQTLQTATILMYINAAFALLNIGLLFSGPLWAAYELATLAGVAAAYGIANDKKIGYQGALAVAFVPLLVLAILIFGYSTFNFSTLINVLFKVALAALLLHPMSKNYAQIWFK